MPANIPIPPGFLERMSHYLGGEFLAFEKSLSSTPVTGLRVNTLKISPGDFESHSPFQLGEPIPWAPASFFLPPETSKPGLHTYHSAGLFYLQDPSAMAPAYLLGLQPGERILDLAASPGGKATALASLTEGKGLLVVNEIKDKRLGHLVMNMERWAAPNVVITNETPEHLADQFGSYFDRVLVDAPCSGEGMFRKDEGARADWSLDMVQGCALRQVNILRVAAHLVHPGGSLLYSTCTFNPEENEEVILNFLDQNPEFHVTELPKYPGFMSGQPGWVKPNDLPKDLKNTLVGAVRLFPHLVRGEGHFICHLLRTGETNFRKSFVRPTKVRQSLFRDLNADQSSLWKDFSDQVGLQVLPEEHLKVRNDRLYYIPCELPPLDSLRLASMGIRLGIFKKERFEPAHPLALFLDSSRAAAVLNINIGDPHLQAFLRGEAIQDPGPSGWILVCVNGFGLGWGKRVQGVIKNHYPRGWIQT